MKTTAYACFMLFCLLFGNEWVFAQRYFKLLDKPAKSYSKKIARFTNGDILIGDSPIDGQTPDQNRGVSIERLDLCGNVLWAKSYGWGINYLEFKDFAIAAGGDIYILGSAYKDFDEMIFLLKLSKTGEILRFRLFNGGTVDHFTYSIALQADQVMVCGLLKGWNSQKEGFVALFDNKLSFKWGKKFAPFESFGEGIPTPDDGFLCRSGPYLVKLSREGDLDWVTAFTTSTDIYPFAGPVAVVDGYVLEAYGGDFGFFYKVDLQGNLVWKSAKFPTTKHPADMDLRPDGTILVAWNSPGTGENFPSLLSLSPAGQILAPRRLVSDLSFNTGLIFHSLSDDNIINIVGSTDPFSIKSDKISDFLLQFPLDSTAGDCYRWENLSALVPNNIPFGFTTIDTVVQNVPMTEINGGNVSFAVLKYAFAEICDQSPQQQTISIDTLLPCDVPWLAYLPGPGFRWDDNNSDNPRLLQRAGQYSASNRECAKSITYSYNLQKEPCKCALYMPNIFSPNQDGWNDRLEISSGCTLQALQMRVYDRWGNEVFESNGVHVFWDGDGPHKPALSGVYLVTVNYTLLDDAGLTRQGTLQQDVTLIR